MTCPYHSRREGKPHCRVHGFVDSGRDKELECLSFYDKCYEQAQETQRKKETVRQPTIEEIPPRDLQISLRNNIPDVDDFF